jgi:acetyl-CoA carboxylase biotin carboxyl carrier protein
MIDLEFVERLIRALDESNLDTLELERGGTRVWLSKSPVPTTAGNSVQGTNPGPPLFSDNSHSASLPPGLGVEPITVSPIGEEIGRAGPPEKLIEIPSPMVGTFYRSPAPEAPPYVAVGDRVGTGTVLCIIEAMKLMNEMESEVEGTIAKILVENAEPVEYGQVLFLLDPS